MGAGWRAEGGQQQGARPYQEDSWALRTLADGTILAIVADGMGGHVGGATASKVVVDAFIATIERGGFLAEALEEANTAVRRGQVEKPSLKGMGSTVIAAMIRDDEVHWISVGDSPFYLVTEGRLERLNADHSMAPQIAALLARGMLTAEEAASHPGRHTLREAVMGEPISLIDEGRRRLGPQDRLLLCSDGVQSLDEPTIAAASTRSVSSMIQAVLAAASPQQDNVTIVKVERLP